MLVLVHWYLSQTLDLGTVPSNFDQSWNPMLKIYSNGKVGLYYAGQGEKLRTTFDGVTYDKKVLLGDNNEMQLESSGNSFIGDIGTGYFGLVSAGTGVKIQKHPANVSEFFANDGAVELYYDNSLFETTELGVRVTGIMSATDDIILLLTKD